MKVRLTRKLIGELQPRERPYEVRDAKLAGLLLRIQPSGVRTWYLDYKLNGLRNRIVLGRSPGVSLDGARDLAEKQIGRVADGKDLQAEQKAGRVAAKKARHSTLKAFLDGPYGDWVVPHRRSGAIAITRIRSDFKDWLEKPMSELNTQLVEAWQTRQRRGGKLPTTINRDVQRLQACLSKAVEWKLLDVHPMAGFRKLASDQDDRVRYLTAEEEDRLRTALVDREGQLREARTRFNEWREARGYKLLPPHVNEFVDHLRPLTLLALNTGLRRGELLGLRWGAIDLQGKVVTVTAATSKSGRKRHVPLNDEAMWLLTAWEKQVSATGKSDYVFGRSEGERMTSIATAWAGLVSRAKIDDFRFHDCRHHFASRLVQGGTDLNVVRELLGHSEIKMTLRYSHLAPENLREAVARVARV